MANQGISMPSSGGGLMRYNEEYDSRLKLKPAHVIIFIIAVIAFTLFLKFFFPIAA
ncbi:MAG: preprotein translocase subunit Sec61beta [Candidatus Nanoarchaeia archaeon]|nr:preprotein translocase subunit Sec61beta [Candidatus Nanoarchaeia archaeon]MDD5740384.1 preprotein translocase subunit Sec61beta [Candidatus Nanoarchaeia archaeon]